MDIQPQSQPKEGQNQKRLRGWEEPNWKHEKGKQPRSVCDGAGGREEPLKKAVKTEHSVESQWLWNKGVRNRLVVTQSKPARSWRTREEWLVPDHREEKERMGPQERTNPEPCWRKEEDPPAGLLLSTFSSPRLKHTNCLESPTRSPTTFPPKTQNKKMNTYVAESTNSWKMNEMRENLLERI